MSQEGNENSVQRPSQQGGPRLLSQAESPYTSNAKPMLAMLHSELGSVSAEQYKKTGFLPPAQKLNIQISDDDEEEDNESNDKPVTNTGPRGTLNPFQQGYLDQNYYNPFQQPLPGQNNNASLDPADIPVTKK